MVFSVFDCWRVMISHQNPPFRVCVGCCFFVDRFGSCSSYRNCISSKPRPVCVSKSSPSNPDETSQACLETSQDRFFPPAWQAALWSETPLQTSPICCHVIPLTCNWLNGWFLSTNQPILAFMWYLFCKVLKKVSRSPGWHEGNEGEAPFRLFSVENGRTNLSLWHCWTLFRPDSNCHWNLTVMI